jgi:hypothetical protein
MSTPSTCYHMQDEDGTWLHIPGCWGAIHDPSGCTCEITGSELELARRARAIAEAHIEKLRDKAIERADRMNAAHNRQRALSARLRQAETDRTRALELLHQVMLAIAARPDITGIFGPAERAIWERARAFINNLPEPN